MATPQLTPEEEQEKLLEVAKNVIDTQAFHMKRCLDQGKLMDALKHAFNMVSELRTSLLSPKTYYALYMLAVGQLRRLESYLYEEKHGKRMAELYELVQYAGDILPRLYLLVTVGSVYIKSKEASPRDVLKDLVEMCRGVQHPTRGLFLRDYLSDAIKDKLPDTGSEYDGPGGNVKDSVEFILQNFTEMNKLWVRMQHQGPVRDRDRRETERLDLRILVGKNLARLSQLEGVDTATYRESVLPRILEQVINCKDKIAQQYLMEVLIQAFPDETHLLTLDSILDTCGQLQTGVDVKTIIVSLIDRLANYAARSPELIPADIDIFAVFFGNVKQVVEQRPNMDTQDVLALQVSLLNLSLKCYPRRLDYVDQVLGFCGTFLSGLKEGSKSADINKPSCVKQIVNLLTIPLDHYKSILTVLRLENYKPLHSFLQYETRKQVSLTLVRNAVENETKISEVEQVDKLLELIDTLVKDVADQPGPDEVDKEDFDEEQTRVASLVHLFHNDNISTLFQLYLAARKHFVAGGNMRMKHTLPALVFRFLRLIRMIKTIRETFPADSTEEPPIPLDDETWSRTGKRGFQFAHELVTVLAQNRALTHVTLRLYLQCAEAASTCAFETIAYEFFSRAFAIYEEEISDSKEQLSAILLIIATLQQVDCFVSEDHYDTLVSKTALHSARLLKKPDQSLAVSVCSHLFWVEPRDEKPSKKDGQRVLEVLQKALKLGGDVMDASANVALFVGILNQFLYYLQAGTPEVKPSQISTLVALINTNLSTISDPSGGDTPATTTFYRNTLDYIRRMKQENPAFQDIVVN